jgi:hypothetical protein
LLDLAAALGAGVTDALLGGLLAFDFGTTGSEGFFKSLDFLERLFGSKGMRSDLLMVIHLPNGSL